MTISADLLRLDIMYGFFDSLDVNKVVLQFPENLSYPGRLKIVGSIVDQLYELWPAHFG